MKYSIFIPDNGSKLRGWRHDFLEKSVGGCNSYDVIALWPGLTRPFLAKSCAKDVPLQNFSVIRPAVRRPFQKTYEGRINPPPPLHGRGINRKFGMSANFHQYVLIRVDFPPHCLEAVPPVLSFTKIPSPNENGLRPKICDNSLYLSIDSTFHSAASSSVFRIRFFILLS